MHSATRPLLHTARGSRSCGLARPLSTAGVSQPESLRVTGYVAFYPGEYKKAVKDSLLANPGDAFIQCLLGQAYEKLGEKDKATEYCRKAATAAAHNPPAAYARTFARKRLG